MIDAIYKLYPQVVYTNNDKAYDKNGNEVEYDKNLIKSYADSIDYVDKRKNEYPPITDYLDGIVKNDQAQIDKYIADCLAVKAKYPKRTP
jgi:hypothetical protein